MKNCPSCGSPMADTAQFCNVCGARVQQTANMQQPYEQMGQQGYGYDAGSQQAAWQTQGYGYDASGQQAVWQTQGYGYDTNGQQEAQQMQGYDAAAQQAVQQQMAQQVVSEQAGQQQPMQQMGQQAYGYDTNGQQAAQQMQGYGYDASGQQAAWQMQGYGYDMSGQQAAQQMQQVYGYDTNGQQVAQQTVQQTVPEQEVQQPAQQAMPEQAVQQTAQQAAPEQAVQQQPVQQQQQAYSYDTNGQQQPMQQTYGYDANAQQAAMQQQMQMQGGYNTTGGEAKLPDYSGMDEAQKEEVRDMVRRASAKALHRKAKRRTTILLVLLVLAAGAAAFVLGMKLHKKTPLYRKAAEKFLTAYCDGDVAAAEACCLEPCRGAVRTQVNAAASVISLYGDGAKMTYKIDEFVPYDEETVGRLQDALKQDYGYECDVSEVYIVKATLKMTADGNTETSEEQLLVIKTGKDWVVWYR